MARRSLRPHLNQIRTWVRQGRTDAWIAHQLEVTTSQIAAFKRENELAPEGEAPEGAAVDFDDEIDLRAEDDALIAAELEAEAARADEEVDEEPEDDEDESEGEGDEDDKPRRRRGRRGGRGRKPTGAKGSATAFEGTFDHGEEGYGLWLDPAVADSPVYAEHWAGHRPVEVTVEENQIVIRRAGEGAGDDD
jgi:hypothetical protein